MVFIVPVVRMVGDKRKIKDGRNGVYSLSGGDDRREDGGDEMPASVEVSVCCPAGVRK